MGFEKCHPAVNFIYFTAVIAAMVLFRHPVFLAVGLLSGFAYSLHRGGRRAAVFNLCLLVLAGAFAIYYSSYNHFGMTVLGKNSIGNNLTLESLVYGLVLGLTAAGVGMWFACVHSVVTADKVVYLFGRLSPRLSMYLAIMLRLVPRIKCEARRINTARQGIGRGVNQGNLIQRFGNGLRIVSMLISWLIEALSTAGVSMASRGSRLRGRRAFSIYRFDIRDRLYVIAMFACLTLTAMAVLLGMTAASYDPRISLSPVSWVFTGGYALLCLLPLLLELWTEYRFQKARRMSICCK